MSDSPKRAGQPPVFWVSLGAAVISLGLLIARVAGAGGEAAAFGSAFFFAILIFGFAIAGFAWEIRSGMRGLAHAFSHAIHIPITVGSELAAASERVAHGIGDDGIRMNRSTYAALAVDSEGVHVSSDLTDEYGLIPATASRLPGTTARCSALG